MAEAEQANGTPNGAPNGAAVKGSVSRDLSEHRVLKEMCLTSCPSAP